MGDGILDFDNSMQDRQYDTKPDESLILGLLNDYLLGPATNLANKYIDTEADFNVNTTMQPMFMGQDSMMSGGESPDYPKFRTYNDFAEYEFPSPTVAQYTDQHGNFDSEGYDAQFREYFNARSEHPTGTNW